MWSIPSENRKLAAELAAKGLIVSEFPMGAVAYPQNFPIRNRIVSGISVGVLVVEGAQYSRVGDYRETRHRPGARGVCRPREHHLESSAGALTC